MGPVIKPNLTAGEEDLRTTEGLALLRLSMAAEMLVSLVLLPVVRPT